MGALAGFLLTHVYLLEALQFVGPGMLGVVHLHDADAVEKSDCILQTRGNPLRHPDYDILYGQNCPSGLALTTATECQQAATALGQGNVTSWNGRFAHQFCFVAERGTYFNTASEAAASPAANFSTGHWSLCRSTRTPPSQTEEICQASNALEEASPGTQPASDLLKEYISQYASRKANLDTERLLVADLRLTYGSSNDMDCNNFLPGDLGLGNRVYALTNVLYVAILTNRVFLLRSNFPKCLGDIHDILSPVGFDPFIMDDEISLAGSTINFNNEYSSMWQVLMNDNLDEKYPERILYTNPTYVNIALLMAVNPHYKARADRLDDDIMGELADILFRPAPFIQQLVDKDREETLKRGSKVLAIQVRMRGADVENVTPEEFADIGARCKFQLHNHDVVILTNGNAIAVKKLLQQNLGEFTEIIKRKYKYTAPDPNATHAWRMETIINTFAEWWHVRMADKLLHFRSTFPTSAALAGGTPVIQHRNCQATPDRIPPNICNGLTNQWDHIKRWSPKWGCPRF